MLRFKADFFQSGWIRESHRYLFNSISKGHLLKT